MDNPPNYPKLAPSLRQPSKVTGPPFSTKPTMRSVLGSSSTCGVTVAPMLLRIESGLPNTPASSTVISLDSDTRRTPGRRVSGSSGNQKNPVVTIGSTSLIMSLTRFSNVHEVLPNLIGSLRGGAIAGFECGRVSPQQISRCYRNLSFDLSPSYSKTSISSGMICP